MIEIEVRNDNIEEAIKQLKMKVGKSGLLREMKEHRYFMSKSEKRKEKIQCGIKRARRIQRSIAGGIERRLSWNARYTESRM